MNRPRRRWLPTERSTWKALTAPAVLVLLAFVPALTAGRGRMPADTKLYLYLDPGRLIGDAPYTFDGRQFAGWVPHQTISYLWPSGPWFLLFEQLRVPDWVAHRLWLGTILFVAALGVRWAARLLGLGASGALAAAAIYELSPYVLPYLSRTSLMLLPYAGLGWIVGLTLLAATRSTWRHASLLALVVATVGAPNATAIAMIAPAPVLWLVHAAWGGAITWHRAAATAARIAALCVAVSLWWLSMLAVQGRYGADVLAYSETLEAVSLTSSSIETLRAMGYWLFYVRDPVGFTTTAAEAYLTSGRLIVTSFLLTGVALAGLAVVRFQARRFAILLVIAGTVLAVGVHPIDDPSALMAPFAESSRSTFVLALRSSTRALPMTVLGLALGAGALVAATGRLLGTRRGTAGETPASSAWPWIPAAFVVVLAALNLPAAWNGGFVDPVLARDQQPPAAWTDAAGALGALPDGYRVMQLPGAEFGAFTWGYTVDPPLPGLTERPFVSRDLLPLGSPAAMDLLYALDDRFQEGVAEPESVAPVARLLGVDTIWLANDVWFDRFRTPRPEVAAALLGTRASGLGEPDTFGEAFVPSPVLDGVDERTLGDPRVGKALEPVWLVPVVDPVPVVRAKTDVVALAGNGDGIVDSAAAGLIDGTELIVYTASIPEGAAPNRVIVTDSNRDQARHWRGSQDTRGFTEDGGPASGVERTDSADQRLEVFPSLSGDPSAGDSFTVAVQDGPLTATASAYGEPFAYRPEDRAAMAVDGDPATAWRVADRFDAAGELIRVIATEPVDALTVVQPLQGSTGLAPNRWITDIDVSVDGGEPSRLTLDERSRTSEGQRIELPATGRDVGITIAATAFDVTSGARPDAVGFAEITTDGEPTTEVIRVPVDWLETTPADVPVDVVLTRLRTEPTERWRRDPEPRMVREVVLPDTATVVPSTLTLRLSPRAGDGVIAELLGLDGPVATARMTGVPSSGGWSALDGDTATAWTTPFGATSGPSLSVPSDATDVTALRILQPSGDHSPISELTLTGSERSATVPVPPADAAGWSIVDVPELAIAGDLVVEIAAIDARTTRDRRSAELVTLPAAIAEIELAGAPVTPLPVFTDLGCRDDLVTIDGQPVSVELGRVEVGALLRGDPISAAPCATPIALSGGVHRIATVDGALTGLEVDRIVLSSPRDTVESEAALRPRADVTDQGRTSRTVTVDDCPDGCWLVLGEGLNDGWSAEVDGHSLGGGVLVDGGFNGWWLPPSDSARTVELRWTPQRTVTIGLLVSFLAVAACVVAVRVDRRRRPAPRPRAPRLASAGQDSNDAWWVVPVVTGGAALALVGPLWTVPAVVLAVVGGLLHRPRLLAVAAFALWGWCGVVVLWRVVRYRPFADAGWPGHFEDLHRPGLLVLVLLTGSLLARDTVHGRAR